ncbi:MAG: type VI secretion system protein ImpJ [Halieaceae bacterium]|jgi:type VI secretion system protein ImpJ
MSTHKVVWSEGMFLQPQHFQQQDRHFSHLLQETYWQSSPYGSGFSELALDTDLLRQGKISIRRARGIMPDGHCFNVPQEDTQPALLDIPEQTRNCVVCLAIPRHRLGGVNYSYPAEGGVSRYIITDSSVGDEVNPNSEKNSLDVAAPALRVLTDTSDLSGFAVLPIARILERREDSSVILDENFVPPCLDIAVSERLSSFQSELSGLLQNRAEALAANISDSNSISSAEFADYLMLTVINRYVPLVSHFEGQGRMHPHQLYLLYAAMAGELSTFGSKSKRPPPFPLYMHDNLQDSFAPIVASLRQSLSKVIERNAISLPLVMRNFGIRVSAINDRSLVGSAQFVLAAKADMDADKLRQLFPNLCKVSSVEKIRELVNLALPGIKLIPLPVAPPQLPYHSGFAYFSLDKTSDHWSSIINSGGFAIHIGEGFPGLELEFWAIREP